MAGGGAAAARPGTWTWEGEGVKVCKECGVPEGITRNHLWTNDGRLLTRDGKQRLVVVERDFLARIFDTLGEDLAGRAFELLREAKAYDAKSYVQSLGGRSIALARRIYWLRRRVITELADFMSVLGLAKLEVLEYRRDGTARFRCYGCYQREFLLGDILGGYLVLHGHPFRHRIEEGEGCFDILIQPSPGEEDPTLRFDYQPEEPLEGYISYKLCNRCGAPFPVSFFKWDTAEGTVMDTRTGRNVVFIDVMGINLAISEMIREDSCGMGGRLEEMLAVNTKEVVDSIIPMLQWKHRRPEERVRDLFFMAFRGMGNPIFTEPHEGGVRVRVENPFNYPLAAGITASFIARGRPCGFTWRKESPGRLEVTVRFDGEG